MRESSERRSRRPSGARGVHVVLGHGEIFGRRREEVSVGGFSIARLTADPHADVQRHTHEAAHFVFVTGGVYVTTASGAPGGGAVPLLVYNPPGTTHRDRFLRTDGRFRGSFLSISISPGTMRELEREIVLPPRAVGVADGRALELVRRLERELRHWGADSAGVAEGLCLALLGRASGHVAQERGAPPAWILRARDLLREGCSAPLSIAEIARECGVHPVHLARAFRGHLGCSPGEYLRRMRIERAASLIRTGSGTLAEVALDSGFCDQSHLTRSFRRAHGITPSEYRRSLAR